MSVLVRRGPESILLAHTGLTAFLPDGAAIDTARVGFAPSPAFRIWDAEIEADRDRAEIVFGSGRAHLRLVPLGDGRMLARVIAPKAADFSFGELCALAGLSADTGFRELAPDPREVTVPWFPLTFAGGVMERKLLQALEDAADTASDPSEFARLAESSIARLLLPLQHNFRNETEWFSDPRRYGSLPIEQFAYSMLTASQRVGHAEVKTKEPELAARVERSFAGSATNADVPPMFTPFRLRDMAVQNRVVVSPMCMYLAQHGMPNDFHLVHIGARALGGAGLVFTEMTGVSAEARISPGCAGIFLEEHVAGWQRIVRFVHEMTATKIGLQLGHAGPKGSTQLGWQRADAPLEEGNWPLIAASDVAFGPANQAPRPMTASDFDEVEQQYRQAAQRAERCGFDAIELHFAHGYLLSSFISPLTNRRNDSYGGSLENRLRFPLRLFKAVRETWSEEKPITVRISATDWAAGGLDADDAVEIGKAFKHAGADAISVSTGQTTRAAKPLYGRQYQVPFSDRIRQEAGIATIAVGAITSADEINAIVAAGRADLCALARPHLVNPAWTLQAAIEQGYAAPNWPKQYLAGKVQAERQRQRGAV